MKLDFEECTLRLVRVEGSTQWAVVENYDGVETPTIRTFASRLEAIGAIAETIAIADPRQTPEVWAQFATEMAKHLAA